MPIYFARTNFRNQRQLFGIKERDRLSHLYTIGKTGTGKSTLLETMIRQDIECGTGCALFDPHGDLAERVAKSVPPQAHDRLRYLNVPDSQVTWHFNPLAGVPPRYHALATAGMVEVFSKLWTESWGPRLEHLLRNTILTLLSVEGASFAMIPRLLLDGQFRKQLVAQTPRGAVRTFWSQEYEGYSARFRAVVTAPLLNKVGAFLTDPLLAKILCGGKSSFRLRSVIDRGEILLVNLSKGQIGEGPSSLLGSLLVSSLSLAGLSRADSPEESRRPFFLYLDEFQTVATLSLTTMLAELRKYGIGLVLAHQYLGQLDRRVQDAVLGNTGTMIAFRIGGRDARSIACEFEPTFTASDFVKLPNYMIYLKLMIDGQVSKPFSAMTEPCGV